jgi:glycosyltransferase involved in cell wall biosynthesis
LKLAAKVDAVDIAYFKTEIEPLLDHPFIEFIGEIGETQKSKFLGNARALLFPIDWPEPFGLVMIEAMSAGTPVIAWSNGSVPEVVTDGVSGRIVDSIEAAACAAGEAVHMDRRKVRAEFERRFTAERMAASHIAAYRVLLARASANTKVMKLPVALPCRARTLATGLGTNGGAMRHSGLDLNTAG